MDALVTDVQLPNAVAGLRGLGRAGYQVIALGDRRTAAGLWSRYAVRGVAGPNAGDSPEAFVTTVSGLAARHGPVVVYPGSEPAITALLAHSGGLPGHAMLPYPGTSAETLHLLRDKRQLGRLASAAGLAVPRTLVQGTARDLRGLSFPTPCVVKPARSGGHPSTAQVVASGQTLGGVLGGANPATELLVQERVRGPLLMLALVLDRDGRPVTRFQQLARRVWPSEAGGASLAVSVPPDDDLVNAAVDMLAAVGFSGLAQLDFIASDDGPMLIDVNPRYYASLPLALTCGVNLPASWHRVAQGDRVLSQRRYPSGLRFRWLEADLRAAVNGTPRVLAHRVSGPRAGAMWARDDPVPGALLFVWATHGRLTRMFSRSSSHTPKRPPSRHR